MNTIATTALSALWAAAVIALTRHHGWLLQIGESLGLIDDDTPHWLRRLYDPTTRRG